MIENSPIHTHSCVSLILAATLLTNTALALTDRELAKVHFPKNLIEEKEQLNAPGILDTASVAVDFDRTGSLDYIVAAYSAGSLSAAVRVLKKRNSETADVVSEPHLPGMSGGGIGIRAIDIDNDGIPEISVAISSPGGNPASWLFKWKSGQLVLISPYSTEIMRWGEEWTTNLGFVKFEDLDGDGKLEVIDEGALYKPKGVNGIVNPSEYHQKIYKVLADGQLGSSATLYYRGEFFRSKGEPKEDTITFPAESPDRNFVLRVRNGTPDGKNRVDEGEIRLNGIKIAEHDHFEKKSPVFEVPIKLQATNSLSVKLKGKPGGKILIMVEERAASPAPCRDKDSRECKERDRKKETEKEHKK